MRYITLILFCFTITTYCQTVEDNFEGTGTISSWYGDNCGIDISYTNPYQQGLNLSNTVLRYEDNGGQYANVRFEVNPNFDLTANNTFSFKIYVPSSSITGSQTNQVSLKLQDGTLGQPWTTQSEIIKPILLNQWQTLTFDFEHDNYINLDGNSLPPIQRSDFNRVLIQVNGEDNTDQVIAFVDDFLYTNTPNTNTIFDTLVWSDEFDTNGSIDAGKWFHQTQLIAGSSWANNEQQHYTNRIDNSYVNNGTLKIVAKGETYTDQGYTKQYTSARLNSKFAFTYGRVEVRAKLSSISGTWPAIWLLGKNINEDGGYWDNEGYGTASWPWCGEIDIMEPNIAKTQILATWHWNNGNGYQYNSDYVSVANTETSQNFHIYALEWTTDSMKIYYDNILVNELSTFSPFNNEFYILLNVAMGGNLGGPIQTGFTQDNMEVDYVRVYQESSLSVTDVVESHKVILYPNPVKNELYIKLSNLQHSSANVKFLDMAGRVVIHSEQQLNSSNISLDVSFLKQGLYIIQLDFKDGNSSMHKFLKQ